MKISIKTTLFFFICLFITPSPCFGEEQVPREVLKIEEAYGGIKDLRGSFEQETTIIEIGKSEKFKGEFAFRIPSMMRWRYTGEKPHDVIINGNEIIIYQKKENQAFKGVFDRERYGQVPIALLGGLGSLRRDFKISKKGGLIVLVPQTPFGNIARIEIEPSEGPFPIKGLNVVDNRSNTVKITLKNVKANTGVKDSEFEFKPPEGLKIHALSP